MKTKSIISLCIILIFSSILYADESFFLIDEIFYSPFEWSGNKDEVFSESLNSYILFTPRGDDVLISSSVDGFVTQDKTNIQFNSSFFSLVIPKLYFALVSVGEVKKEDFFAKINKQILIDKKSIFLRINAVNSEKYPQFTDNDTSYYFKDKDGSKLSAITNGQIIVNNTKTYFGYTNNIFIYGNNLDFWFLGIDEVLLNKNVKTILAGDEIGIFGKKTEDGFRGEGVIMSIVNFDGIHLSPIVLYIIDGYVDKQLSTDK